MTCQIHARKPRNLRRSGFLATLALLVACADDEGATGDNLDGGPGADVPSDTSPDGIEVPDAMSDAGVDSRFADLAAAIDADLARNNATAASVSVWVDGEIVWVGGFGSLDDGSRAIDENTLFMIGSDTKKIASIALLQAVEASAATLETTIADIFPDLVMEVAPDFVTASVHDLLSHQGGIVDGVEVTTSTDDGALLDFTFGEFASTYYPLAPPGTFWNYSNPNFSLAGLLTQELDGRPWADIVEDDVFAPLGMTRTFARKSEVDENHAPGFGVTAPDDETVGSVTLEEIWESAFVRPAGLVWSTPSDQLRLARFLVDGDANVLSDELRATVSAAQAPMFPDLPGDYGYGLIVGRGLSMGELWYDVPVWSHGGNTWTHTSTFYVLPEQRFAISILSNGLGDDFTQSVVTAIATLVSLPSPSTEPAAVFNPDALNDLVGSYFDEFNAGELVISREGDSLRLDAPLLDRLDIPYEHELTPLSTYVWIANVQEQDLDFAFIEGPLGEMYLRNRAVVAIRPPADAEKARTGVHREPPTISPESLRAALLRARLDPIPPLLLPSRGNRAVR